MNNYVELIETYSQQISIRDGTRFDACVGAEIMQGREMNLLKRRHKPNENPFADLIELFNTPVEARREEEPITESKEEDVNCALCGKPFGHYDKIECGRPLIDAPVCSQCKVKCRNYEDAVKKSYPASLQYYPRSSDLED